MTNHDDIKLFAKLFYKSLYFITQQRKSLSILVRPVLQVFLVYQYIKVWS